MARTIVRTLLGSLLVAGLVVAAPGCKKNASPATALSPPAAPKYDNPFAELSDLRNQIQAHVDWVSQPLREASGLGEEFVAVQNKHKLDARTLGRMTSAAFNDGKVLVADDAGVAAEARADVAALLAQVKAAGEAVAAIPKRVARANEALEKVTPRLNPLGERATSYLKKERETATGEARAAIEINLSLVPELTVKARAAVGEAITKVRAVPTESRSTISALRTAFAGEGEFPKLDPPAKGEVSAETQGDAQVQAGPPGV